MNKEEIVYAAIRQIANTDKPERFAEINQTTFKVAMKVAELMQPSLPEGLKKCLEYCFRSNCSGRSIYEKHKELLSEIPEGLKGAAEQYADKNCHNYVENESDRNELLYAFKAGAEWMAEQGETMQITDDTQWEEVDRFVHRNCDGASAIQIRKK